MLKRKKPSKLELYCIGLLAEENRKNNLRRLSAAKAVANAYKTMITNLKLLAVCLSLIPACLTAAIAPPSPVAILPGVMSPSQSVTLAWSPSPDVTVTGYNLYWWRTSTSVTNKVDVGLSLTTTVSNLLAGRTYGFFATAYDSAGTESEPSNFVTYTPATNGPAISFTFSQTNQVAPDLVLRLFSSPTVVSNYTLLAAVVSTNWLPITNRPGGTNWYVPIQMVPGQRFFRASLSNFWSESDLSVTVSTPPVLSGELKTALEKGLPK